MDSKIIAFFKKADPVLYRLLKKVGPSNINLSSRPPAKYFAALCTDIISQQLSGKVADVFWARFTRLFPRKRITPALVLSLPDPVLRGIGISNSKVTFLKSLAGHFISKKIAFAKLPQLTSEQVIGELIQIKGVGRWTAEMFLMFTLGRSDVFSAGDQGLKNAIKKHYPVAPDPAIWAPYRTYACLILWRSLDL